MSNGNEPPRHPTSDHSLIRALAISGCVLAGLALCFLTFSFYVMESPPVSLSEMNRIQPGCHWRRSRQSLAIPITLVCETTAPCLHGPTARHFIGRCSKSISTAKAKLRRRSLIANHYASGSITPPLAVSDAHRGRGCLHPNRLWQCWLRQ